MPVSLVQRGPFSYDELTVTADQAGASPSAPRDFTLTNAIFDSTIGEVLEVFVNGVKLVGSGLNATGDEFTVDSNISKITIETDSNLTSATDSTVTTLAENDTVLIRRVSNRTAKKVDFAPGSVIREADLDNATTQVFHVAQEAIDTALQGMVLDAGRWNAESGGANRVIKNAATPASSDPSHYVATKGYVDGQNTTATVASIENQVVTVAGVSDKVTTVANAVAETIAYTVTVAGGKFKLAGGEFSSATNNPVLNLQRGSTYTFDYSDSSVSSGSHVLGFSTVDTNTNNDNAVAYTGSANGITDNTVDKIITFVVPSSAPNTLYYYCTAHAAMGNTMNVAEDSIEIVADNIANVNKVAVIDGNVTKVANIDGDVTKVVALGTDGADVTTVANIGTNGADVTTVAGKATEIDTLVNGTDGTSGTGGSTNNLTLIDNVEGALPNINTVATNISNVNSFANTYFGAHASDTAVATHISTNSLTLGAGDLYYRTSGDTGLKSYNGSAWESMETSVGGNTVTSTTGNNLNLVTPSNSNNVVINSGSNSIQLPNVRASQDNYVLAMSDKTTGETAWQVTATAPTITGITSGQLNSYYDVDGTTVSNDKGGTLVIAGTDFGTASGDISVVRICASDGTSQINATTVSSVSDTSITATWNGTEGAGSPPAYATFSGVYHIEIVKSGMVSNRFNSTKSFSSDPTISSVTGTGGEGENVTVTASNLGSYGGKIAGGGQESNTKLLLNFDRSGGTDFEDSSNTSDDGHRVTASGDATIKSSPFGDGKSAIKINGSTHKLQIPNSTDFNLGTSACVEFWVYQESTSSPRNIINHGGVGTTDYDGWTIGFQAVTGQDDGINFYRRTSGTSHTLSSGGGYIKPNHWHHVAYTRDGTTARIFIDGKLTNSGSDVTATTVGGSNNDLKIGIEQAEGGGRFAGYIDEIRIVNGSPVYTSDFTVPTSRLTAITNTKLLIHSNQEMESSTYAYPVDLNATTVTTTNGRTNWNNSNFYINGSTGVTNLKITNTGSSWTTSSGMCIEFWVKAGAGYANNDYIFSFHKDSNNFTYLYYENSALLKLWENSSGTYTLIHNFNPNNDDYNSSSDPSSASGWSHFAITCDSSGNWNLYTDGVLATRTGSHSSQVTDFTGFDFYFGCVPDNTSYGQPEIYFEDLRLTCGSTVYSGTSTSTANFTLPTGPLTTTWSANPFGGSNTASNSTASNVQFLLHGDGASFTDSSSSNHDITATGSYHSQSHGGIAPAMAFPASLKKTGSSGVYFDSSNSDYLILGADTTGSILLKDDTHVGSIDFWMYAEQLGDYPLDTADNVSYKHTSLVAKGDIVAGFKLTSDGGLLHHAYVSPHTAHCKTAANIIETHRWYHLCMAWDSDSSISIFVDGVLRARATDSIKRFKVNTHTDAYGPRIGWHRTYSDGYFHGYIDNFRIVQGSLPMDTTGDPLYSSTAFSAMSSVGTTYFSVPTKIYGAMYPTNPSVGTITITGATTDSTDIAFSEINNSLPNGLTLTDGGVGNQTATITGTLTEVVSSDTTKNNIRIQAKANADDKRITEVNENYSGASTAGAGNLSITKKAGAPVLFNARRYDGNQTNREINGFGFAPDFVWLKNRNTGINHCLFDSVRGATKQIDANTNGAETTQATMLTAFNKDGFSHGTDTAGNKTDDGHIAWGWKAGGAPVSITSGLSNVSSVTQSASSTSGFSITKWSGGGATGYFPHNLGAKPDWVIIKRLNSADDWIVWHNGLDSGNSDAGDWIRLDTNDQKGYSGGTDGTSWDYFGGGISNTNIQVTNSSPVNASGSTYICYAWKAVAGVSAFGTYEGNSTSSSVTPQTITTGFAPSFVMIKSIDSTDSWWMFDNKRVASGVRNNNAQLRADTDHTEATNSSSSLGVTLKTDNGFTVHDYGSGVNGNGNTYIYMAFA